MRRVGGKLKTAADFKILRNASQNSLLPAHATQKARRVNDSQNEAHSKLLQQKLFRFTSSPSSLTARQSVDRFDPSVASLGRPEKLRRALS